MVSTINKNRPSSLFRGIFAGAPDNNFKKLMFGVFSRPGRDEDWWQERYKEAMTGGIELRGLSPELYMEQEYPRNEEEMLRPSRVISAFDIDALVSMRSECREPVETRGPGGAVRIFQRPAVGKVYVAGTDSSHGVGKDRAATAVIDYATGGVVADIYSRFMQPDVLAHESVLLLAEYWNPLWCIEDNDWGRVVIRRAEELEYPNLFERKKDTPGWHTMSSNRPVLWGDLMEAVRNRLIAVFARDGLEEFFSVRLNPDKDGRPEAMPGANDDYPTACALAWQMRKYVRTGKLRIYDPRTVGRPVPAYARSRSR